MGRPTTCVARLAALTPHRRSILTGGPATRLVARATARRAAAGLAARSHVICAASSGTPDPAIAFANGTRTSAAHGYARAGRQAAGRELPLVGRRL